MYITNRRAFKDVHRLVKEALWDHWVGEALCPDSSSVEYACRQSKQTRFIVSCRFVTYCTCQYVYLSATVRQTTTNEHTCSAAYGHFYIQKIVYDRFNSRKRVKYVLHDAFLTLNQTSFLQIYTCTFVVLSDNTDHTEIAFTNYYSFI